MEEGTTNFGVNRAGFMLHSAIHAARPDVKCVIHLHTPNIVAVRVEPLSVRIRSRIIRLARSRASVEPQSVGRRWSR